MSELLDPFEILLALRADDDRDRIAVGELPDADVLLRRILEGDARAIRRAHGRSRRRWVVAASVVTGSLVAASAAAAVLWQRHTSDHRVLACYAGAATDADRYEMRIESGDDPVEACAVLWTDGTFGTAGQPVSQVCATSAGTTAVVPGDDVTACVRAGLEAPERFEADDETLEEQKTVDRLSSRLVDAFIDVCLDEQASRSAAEAALREEGLDEWTVVVSVPFAGIRQCGAADVDLAEQKVVIAAIPPEPEGDG